MAEEKTISPEEKLLNVIKSGGPAAPEAGAGKAAAAQAPAPAAAAKPAAAVPAVKKPAAPTPVPAAAPAPAAKPPAPAAKAAPPAAEPKAPAAAAAKPAPPAAEPKAAAPASDDKAKLKLAKAPEAGEKAAAGGAEPPKKPADASTAPVKTEPVPFTPLPSKKPSEKKLGVGTINWGLAAGVLLFLGLSAVEIRGKLQTDERFRRGETAQPPTPVSGSDASLFPLPAAETVTTAFERDPFVRPESPGGGGPKTSTTTNVVTVLVNWQQYVKEHVKLLGFSGPAGENAVLNDSKANRMSIVAEGEEFLVEGQKLKVFSVKNEEVILTDGKNQMVVK